ncbi:MAG: hypothetical protein AMJ78_03020 [Omnitrophica WOR_2 bacterium SM23_29]|nr:MAG: hypothetical protein AMJ78_03020 [Omnitrophica WOR_2 bacterium SM23_29]
MRFLATKELGRLCKWLRILGYDCEYFTEDNLVSLTIKSLQEDRVILTRNVRLSERAGFKVVHIKHDLVKEQLKQVLNELKLKIGEEGMFTRCVICNLSLEDVKKEEAEDKVPPFVYKMHDDFVRCPKCGRVYWHGTHWGNVREYINGIYR